VARSSQYFQSTRQQGVDEMKPFTQPISEARKISAMMTKSDNARLALAAWDPNANLARKLAERRAEKASR